MLKLKKSLNLFLCFVLVCSTISFSSFAAEKSGDDLISLLKGTVVLKICSSKAFVNGQETLIDKQDLGVTPVVTSNRTLVPVRFISENMGAKVDWNGITSTATITYGSNNAKITLNQKKIEINGAQKPLDVSAQLLGSRTYLPLRILVEDILGKKLFYNDGIIVISSKESTLDLDKGKELFDYIEQLYAQSNGVVRVEKYISGGYSHSVALKNDGTAWFWGERWLPDDGKSNTVLIPEKMNGITDAIQVSAGGRYTLVLKRDGTVWIFGNDEMGWVPTQVEGLSEVVNISAGYDGHCIALKKDGAVWTWQGGRTGNSATTAPRAVEGLNGVKKVAAGFGFSVALKNDGTVWEWSDVSFRAFAPTKVEGLSDIIDISAGQSIVAALKSDRTLFTAGADAETLLTADSSIKKYDIKGIVGISAQSSDWAALLEDGTVMTGGYSSDGKSITVKTPKLVEETNDAIEISYGGGYLLALKRDGSLAAVGSNNNGQLGDGTMISRSLPVKVLFNIDPAIEVKSENTSTQSDLIYNVGDEKAKELNQLGDKLTKDLDNQTDNFKYEVVNVSDAEQFIKNIKSNTNIVVDHKKNYVLTDVLDKGVNNKDTMSTNAYDGKELTVKGVNNLKICSDTNEVANIMVSPVYANVIIFEDCNNITIENIRAGHGPKKGGCRGGVFVFKNCKNIKIIGSTLYGCGTEGFNASGVDGMLVKNSIIEDCTYQLLTMNKSKNVLFEKSKFRDTSEFDLINIADSENIVFSNCEIADNAATGYDQKLWKVSNVSPMLIVRDTTISNNKADYFKAFKDNIYFSNIKFLNNTFTKGSYETD